MLILFLDVINKYNIQKASQKARKLTSLKKRWEMERENPGRSG